MKRRQQNRVTNRKSNLLNRIDILRNKEKPAIDKIRLNGGFLSNSSTVYEGKKERTNRPNNDLSLRVPLKNEMLNLWNDFLLIIDYIKATPEITKIISSL